jgi:hypothetical protein
VQYIFHIRGRKSGGILDIQLKKQKIGEGKQNSRASQSLGEKDTGFKYQGGCGQFFEKVFGKNSAQFGKKDRPRDPI